MSVANQNVRFSELGLTYGGGEGSVKRAGRRLNLMVRGG